jgi:hypothetical protein
VSGRHAKRATDQEGEMATKRTTGTPKRVKSLAAKKISPKRAKQVKGGEIVISKDTDKSTNKLL